jgi:hypothetical protein
MNRLHIRSILWSAVLAVALIPVAAAVAESPTPGDDATAPVEGCPYAGKAAVKECPYAGKRAKAAEGCPYAGRGASQDEPVATALGPNDV